MQNNKTKKNLLLIITSILAVTLILAGIYMIKKGMSGTGQNIEKTENEFKKVETEIQPLSTSYDYYGILNAVDDKKATGEAGFSLKDGNFLMAALFKNLDEPQNGYFYEGWLVNPTDGKFISTGKLSLATESWMNTFSANQDYTAYNKYVLTIEPDDGNPEPATHILEGVLSKNSNTAANSTSSQAKNGYISLTDYQNNQADYNTGDIVLFFNASWCPTCKVLDESLKKQASAFPEKLTVISVDYDTNKDLRKKYSVPYQHYLVQIDSKGNEIKHWAGGGDLQSITDQLK